MHRLYGKMEVVRDSFFILEITFVYSHLGVDKMNTRFNGLVGNIGSCVEKVSNDLLDSYKRGEKGIIKHDGTWGIESERRAEEYLRESVTKVFESARYTLAFYGEESGWSRRDNADFSIVVDPVDGSRRGVSGITGYLLLTDVVYEPLPRG